MKRRGRHKANKWYLICSVIDDPINGTKERNRGMSRKHFRQMYSSIIDPKPFVMPRLRRGCSIWKAFGRWDYCVHGETADGKTVYLFSDLPPKRYK